MAAKLFNSFDDILGGLKNVNAGTLNLNQFRTFNSTQFTEFLNNNGTVWKNLNSIDKRILLGINNTNALTRLATLDIQKVDDLIKIGIKSVDDLAKLKITSVDNLQKLGITNVDVLKKLNVRHISDLNKVGINNFDDLSKLGLKSVDDLVKLKITSMSQLNKFGLNSVDDLKKFNINSADDLVKIGIKNADDLKKLGITNADDLTKLGITNADDIAKAYNKSNVGVQFIKNNAKRILYVTGGSIAGFALFTKEGRDSILKPLIQTSGTIIGETAVETAKALWDLVPESIKTAIELFIYLIIGYIFTSMLPPGKLQNGGYLLVAGGLIYLFVIAYARNDEIIE
jgi:uncharacterized protein YunC (DUF1805 family)